MFTKSARFYDRIYGNKDYDAEVAWIREAVAARLAVEKGRLLDVACGTGAHLVRLRDHFDVEGLDLSEELIEIARRKLPDVPLHVGDMIDFELGRTFDLVTCLFSSIGYVQTGDNLHRALNRMAHHVAPGGLLLIEPWFTPRDWRPGMVHAVLVEDEDLKIARVSTSFARNRLSWFDLHYLVGTPVGTSHFVERHKLGLFERSEMEDAIRAAGLEPEFDETGPTERGFYFGRRPA